MSEPVPYLRQEGANIPPVKTYADKFAGHVVMVTGAAQGIGAVTAASFAAQGAHVILVDINAHKLLEVLRLLLQEGRKVLHRVCNLADETDVVKLIDGVLAETGKIDILVHLAGIYPFRPLTDVPTDEYRRVMDVNMSSTFFLCRAILPHMNKAGYGRIITTTSGTVLTPERGLSAYITAKSAVLGFTRALAIEAGPGVTANSVCPGLIYNESTSTNPGSKVLFEKVVGRQAVKRYGLPSDVTTMICFIASPEADFITGQNFDVGGGYTHGA